MLFFRKKIVTMKLSYQAYTLQLENTFTLATSSRSTTPVMLVEIEHEGLIWYGEASMPPYLGESHTTVAKFLWWVDLTGFSDPSDIESIMNIIDSLAPGNTAAKSAIDIALHDLVGKIRGTSWHQHWWLSLETIPSTSYTIGMDTPKVIKQKVEAAQWFKLLKVKLWRDNDKEIIETIRSCTNLPLCVDCNQWRKDTQQAIDMSHWLAERGVVYIEQPMDKNQPEQIAILRGKSPLPIIADEAVQRLSDIAATVWVYDAINIKLMKCTGLHEAKKMITLAQSLGLKIMLWCMTETSCAIAAAAQLSPLVDWTDLDGNLLITNDPFVGTQLVNGKVLPSTDPGIWIHKI